MFRSLIALLLIGSALGCRDGRTTTEPSPTPPPTHPAPTASLPEMPGAVASAGGLVIA